MEPEQEPPGMNAPSTTLPGHAPVQPASNARILMASLVGTSVEFYDFYIYATAASLVFGPLFFPAESQSRSEEHTSELQSLMRIPYAVSCLKIKTNLTPIKQQ